MPFEINAPQWVDGASAERWVAVPGTASVTWGKGVWGDDKPAWPKDSVLVRTLSLPASLGDPTARKPVETQLLHFDGRQWQGYTYAWNDAADRRRAGQGRRRHAHGGRPRRLRARRRAPPDLAVSRRAPSA